MQNALLVYIGTYTAPKSASKGIYLYEMDAASGRLSERGLAGESDNPSFLAFHPGRRFLYAVNEVGEFAGAKTGAVSAFAVDPASGKLSLLNQQPSGGAGPCFVTVDATGRYALVANYVGGSFAVLPIGPDGRLRAPSSIIQHKAPDGEPRKKPHGHSIHLDAGQKVAFAVDLGLDKVCLYGFRAADGALLPHDPAFASMAAGAGPRHFVWHPSGRLAYVINELSSTMTAFSYDSDRGFLEELQTLPTVPAGFAGQNSCAEVQVHPSGRFLYGSNRGHDSIAVFAIDGQTGRLKPLGHESTRGKTPRNFAIDPTGAYLLVANQDSDTVVVFDIAVQTGLLKYAGVTIEVPAPACVRFLAAPGS